MNKRLMIALAALCANASVAAERGETVFATYCAACHGSEGAGLVGPNLTDAEVVHGEELDQIKRVIAAGVPGTSMPAWSGLLTEAEIEDVSCFVKSIMGKNLPSPIESGVSAVTPFPAGTQGRPLLMRTFMPTLGIGDEVFAHHHQGRPTPKYSPQAGTFELERLDQPIAAVPGAIAVNFGEALSYCFDSTECRLLYTWSGGFMDMTNYWGEGSGGGRKSFGYIGELLGPVAFRAAGPPPVPGQPQFKGYRKRQGVPEFMYSIGEVDFTLRIAPGQSAGVAVCHYTARGVGDGLRMRFAPEVAAQISSDRGVFKDGTLQLSPEEAASFTLTIEPQR